MVSRLIISVKILKNGRICDDRYTYKFVKSEVRIILSLKIKCNICSLNFTLGISYSTLLSSTYASTKISNAPVNAI